MRIALNATCEALRATGTMRFVTSPCRGTIAEYGSAKGALEGSQKYGTLSAPDDVIRAQHRTGGTNQHTAKMTLKKGAPPGVWMAR